MIVLTNAAARPASEVVERAKAAEATDFFGFMTGDLIGTLPFEDAKSFLKEGAKAEEWEPESREPKDVLARIIDYLPFAWDKANGCRGLSAGRSISHFQAWLWLLGADKASDQIGEYSMYGKPQLRAISEAVGFDWKSADDGDWANNEGDNGVGPDQVTALRLDLSPLAVE